MFGCSTKDSPIIPSSYTRFGLQWNPNQQWALWDSAMPSNQFKNVDLSVLVDGVDLTSTLDDPSTIYAFGADRHLTIAATVQQWLGESPPVYTLEYAWLDDVFSPSYRTAYGSGIAYTSTVAQTEEITAPRVAAIRSYSTLASVGIAYMSRYGNDDWDVNLITMDWNLSEDGLDESPTTVSLPEPISDYDGNSNDNNTDDWSPDLAWDSATGELHIVWTGYTGESNHPYRVRHTTWDSTNGVGDMTWIYDDGDYDYAGWAPRIAIGSGIEGCDDIVGIVYSEYSEVESAYKSDLWHVGAAYWEVDSEDPEDAHFLRFSYLDGEGDHAGYPRLDLAPRGSGDCYGSIVFTQRDYDDYNPITYRTIEINNLRNDWWVVVGNIEEADEEFNGAVSIYPDDNEHKASISFFESYDVMGTQYWLVGAGQYDLDVEDPDPGWAMVDAGIEGEELEWTTDFIDFLQIDTFQTGDIVTVSTNNEYWLGYCDKIDSGAATVNVAYGYAE